jgi:thioredoxin reductase (NADPH)
VEGLVAPPDGDLSGIRLRNVATGGDLELATSGLFVAIGHEPEVGLFAEYLETENGHIRTSPTSTATSVEGVFAAGDVADSRYRQAVTAAASGCMAAIDAERWLAAGEWHGFGDVAARSREAVR